MGQSYLIVNPKKKEYIHPHTFGDGQKLIEFGTSAMGTMAGLSILLTDGAGDISQDPVTNIIGRWAGNPIVIAGQYCTKKFVIDLNLYKFAEKNFTDISYDVLFALMADSFIRQEIMRILKGSTLNEAVVKDFNVIHKQLIKRPGAWYADMILLVGRLKTKEGNGILEKFLKR